MAIEQLDAATALGLRRDTVVVCLLTGADGEQAEERNSLATIKSVLEHTDASTTLIVIGTAAQTDRVVRQLPAELRERAILSLPSESDAQRTRAVNAASQASSPSDLVLVASGIRVAADWLPRLAAAARSDSTVASATPLSSGLGGVAILDDHARDPAELYSTPQGGGGEDAGELLRRSARQVAEHSPRLRPRIATVGPGCAYLRRGALEVTGPLNESLPVDAALADHALRAIAAGMVHVAADDVLVASPPGAQRAGGGAVEGPARGSQVQETLLNDEHGRLHRARAGARRALRMLSVTIDARALTSAVGGTQTYIIELIAALAQKRQVAVRVLIAPDIPARAADALADLPDVEIITYEQAIDRPRRTDVVHRPQSVFTPDDLTLLRLLGERMVIGQLDLIAYHNFAYHHDVDHWRAYRRTTRLALGGADQVIFFSEHARRDALADDLLPESRTHVVGIGSEALELGASEARPEGFAEDGPFLLCLGADYAHKNRPFAIELLGALRELGWTGRLVLAGAHVPWGSSREREHDLLACKPELAESVVDLGPIDEPSKRWLYRRARALVYPTLYEGFGLLPLEAARAGLPCLFASQASLSEVGGSAATLVAWDPRASASAVLPLLHDGPAREAHLASLRALSIPPWGELSERIVAVYEQAVAVPPPEAAVRISQELDRESFIGRLESTAQEYQHAYHGLEARVGHGLPLIDEGGLLSRSQQRGLMRVAARGRLGALLLAPFGLLGRRAAETKGEAPRDSPSTESLPS